MPTQEASVLFGRISGLAALMSGSHGEEYDEILNEFFARTEEAIRLHSGIVLDFSGESFSAVFLEGKSRQEAVETAKECLEKIEVIVKEKKLPQPSHSKPVLHTQRWLNILLHQGTIKVMTIPLLNLWERVLIWQSGFLHLPMKDRYW